MKINEQLFGLLGTAIRHGQPKPGVEKSYEYMELVGFWQELSKNFEFQDFGSLKKVESHEAYSNLFYKTLT